MKIRIYPKKDLLLQRVLEEKGDLEDLLADTETAIGSLSEAIIVDPTKESRLKSDKVVYERRLKEIMDLVGLLESHDPPEVMAEIEL